MSLPQRWLPPGQLGSGATTHTRFSPGPTPPGCTLGSARSCGQNSNSANDLVFNLHANVIKQMAGHVWSHLDDSRKWQLTDELERGRITLHGCYQNNSFIILETNNDIFSLGLYKLWDKLSTAYICVNVSIAAERQTLKAPSKQAARDRHPHSMDLGFRELQRPPTKPDSPVHCPLGSRGGIQAFRCRVVGSPQCRLLLLAAFRSLCLFLALQNMSLKKKNILRLCMSQLRQP